MIVEPDFLNHWKTKLLIAELNDKAAPCYIISLWAHCQQRKSWVFSGLTQISLSVICGFHGDPQMFTKSLVSSGFIKLQINGEYIDKWKDGCEVIAHGWSDVNASLIRNWKNGLKGGRPSVKNPDVTQRKPKHNPELTDREDKIREDKIREDKNKEEIVDWSKLLPFTSKEFFESWIKWVTHRAEINKKLTYTQIRNQLAEMKEWGEKESIERINRSITNGWQGLFENKVKSNAKQHSETFRNEGLTIKTVKFS